MQSLLANNGAESGKVVQCWGCFFQLDCLQIWKRSWTRGACCFGWHLFLKGVRIQNLAHIQPKHNLKCTLYHNGPHPSMSGTSQMSGRRKANQIMDMIIGCFTLALCCRRMSFSVGGQQEKCVSCQPSGAIIFLTVHKRKTRRAVVSWSDT